MIVLGVFVTRGVDQLFYQVDQKEPGTYQNFSQTFEGASLTTSKLDIFYHLILNMKHRLFLVHFATMYCLQKCRKTEFSPWVLSFFPWVLSFFLEFWVFSLIFSLSFQFFPWVMSFFPLKYHKLWVFYWVFTNLSEFLIAKHMVLYHYSAKICRDLEFFPWVIEFFLEFWVFSPWVFFKMSNF